MKLVSLNVGRSQEYVWAGKKVQTGILKQPVAGKRNVSLAGIEGDEQADLRVHGGANKAVYAYDLTNYEHWKTVLHRPHWEHGLFGENLTTEGLPDSVACIGDVYTIGTATLQVVQPRFPCFKLNIRFDLLGMMDAFVAQRRNGLYLKVLEEGALQAGDAIQLKESSPFGVTVQAYVDCYYSKGKDKALVDTILSIPFLPPTQRQAFEVFNR